VVENSWSCRVNNNNNNSFCNVMSPFHQTFVDCASCCLAVLSHAILPSCSPFILPFCHYVILLDIRLVSIYFSSNVRLSCVRPLSDSVRRLFVLHRMSIWLAFDLCPTSMQRSSPFIPIDASYFQTVHCVRIELGLYITTKFWGMGQHHVFGWWEHYCLAKAKVLVTK
jgi:hypothetical protein